jgi:hypothetical protein
MGSEESLRRVDSRHLSPHIQGLTSKQNFNGIYLFELYWLQGAALDLHHSLIAAISNPVPQAIIAGSPEDGNSDCSSSPVPILSLPNRLHGGQGLRNSPSQQTRSVPSSFSHLIMLSPYRPLSFLTSLIDARRLLVLTSTAWFIHVLLVLVLF